MHPGTVTDRDCILSGNGFYPRELMAWNRRTEDRYIADFRSRARMCRTNMDAYDDKAAAVWDFAADAIEENWRC